MRQQAELLSGQHDVLLLEKRNEQLNPTFSTAAGMIYSRSRKKEVIAIVHDFRPDLIHIHNAYPALGPAVHLAAENEGVPLVMTVHNHRLRCPNGYAFTQGAKCSRCQSGNYLNALLHDCFPTSKQAAGYATALWLHRFLLPLERRTAMFIAPSRFLAERMTAWEIPAEKVVVVRHFVRARRQMPPALGNFGLYLGRLSPEKGLQQLIEALARSGDPPFRIAGDGPSAGDLRRLAEQFGLKNTSFLGWVSHEKADALLAECRYLASPSMLEETAGLSAMEAMALGRPVLVSRLGALPELVSSGGGLVCDPQDLSDLTEKLQLLATDDDLCAEAGRVAWLTAREHLSPDKHLSGLVSAYEQALRWREGHLH